jgi:hypothetical protein
MRLIKIDGLTLSTRTNLTFTEKAITEFYPSHETNKMAPKSSHLEIELGY